MFKMFSRLKVLSRLRFSDSISRLNESTGNVSKSTYSQLFFDDTVQDLLKKLILVDLESLFRPRNYDEQYEPRKYKLMTTKQLEEEQKKAMEKVEYLLQIPPLIDPVEDKTTVIDECPDIDGFDIHHSKHIFVDTSKHNTNEKRIIVVREPNGILRTCNRDERHRINQIYFPMNGRELIMPKMFEEQHLKKVLERNEYKFILDRACIQFEPDDPMYHKIIEITYEQILSKMDFKAIYSSRHFGQLAFYLVTHKKIDNMLIYFLKSEKLNKAYFLVQLYHIIHPSCKSAEFIATDKNADVLKSYINLDANDKSSLNTALNYCLTQKEEKGKLEAGIREAHGLQ